MKEEWKNIEEFPKYSVSNKGRVFSSNYEGHNYGEMKKPSRDKDGYLFVCLWKNGKSHTRRISRLIAKAFILNPQNKPQVNHKNGIKDDNRIENLEWCTPSENTKHAFDNNLTTPVSGEKNGMAKLNKDNIIEMRRKYGKNKTKSNSEIAKEYNIKPQQVSRILNYKRWTNI